MKRSDKGKTALTMLVKFLIWSTKCNSWYRPNSLGYTINPDVAGRYSKAEADSICEGTHGQCRALDENTKYVARKRKEYMELKEREIWSAMQTMTPIQAEEITYRLVRERGKLWESGGI